MMAITNAQISSVLRDIADLLSLQNGGRFRIQAYAKAADAISFLDRDATQIYKQEGLEGLEEIPGVGDSIARKIAELIETGRLRYLNKLQRTVPPVELELLKIPGVGPKTAARLVEKLALKSLKELPKVLSSPQGEKIFPAKSRANILKGLAFLKQQDNRLLINIADNIAVEILAVLNKAPGVSKADSVGSLRRRQETIGDIDLVAASTRPAATISFLLKQPFVKQIINQGETKTSFINNHGVHIDVEILPPAEYGSLLQHFTGSRAHNIHLRTYAENQKISLSEHGVKIGRRLYRCADETCVYNHLHMPLIPPELREDRGEIEAALTNTLPDLITLADIRGDLHVHSNWTDGRNTIIELARAARDLGYEYLVVSDHTAGLGIAHGLKERDILSRQQEIAAANEQLNHIRVLSGLEVNILAGGQLDISQSLLSQTDVVTASLHSGFGESKTSLTKRLIRAMANPHVDIIGHPSGRLINTRAELNLDWPAIFRQAAATRTALEINASPHRLDLKDTLVQQAREFDVSFAINTDTHQLSQLANMRYGVDVARRGWLRPSDVINALPLSRLLKLLTTKSSL